MNGGYLPMKKLIALVLALICMLELVGCKKTASSLDVYSFPEPTTQITGIFYSQGQENAFKIGSENCDSDDLSTTSVIEWFYGLKLIACDKPEEVAGAEGYDFYVQGENAFTYEDRGIEAYIIIGGNYYEVRNPSIPPINFNILSDLSEEVTDGGDLKTEKALLSSQVMTDPVASVNIQNIFTGESANITENEDIRTISNILFIDSWNGGATTDCLNNIEIAINGLTYRYHSDCGTFNDTINQRYLSLDDETANVVDTLLAKYISLTSTEIPAE